MQATETLGVRSPEPHWDAIGTAVIRLIRPRGIGVERILMQNRVGELTPSVSVARQGLHNLGRAIRRSRRQRKTRYRLPRFLNRRRPEGWLAPSLAHRVETTLTWVNRLRRLCPITALSMELVRFDTQVPENPELGGVAYQQGTLAGYEVWEYLVNTWERRCAYCGAKATPLHVEPIVPRTRGGSDRGINLTLACEPCNTRKGTQTAEEFGHAAIQAQARRPLKDAAAVNTTRWSLYRRLVATGLPVEVGTGGRTKYNRTRLGLEKTHWHDAACIGASTPHGLEVRGIPPLRMRATGDGMRQLCPMGMASRAPAPRPPARFTGSAPATSCGQPSRERAGLLQGLRYETRPVAP